MPEGRYIAYYRVSTARQGASGLGQEAQRQAVEAFTAGNGWELVGEFHEVESGKRHENRPELERALADCRRHKATLVIAKLDRLARNVHFISGLMESGVDFVAADMPDANRLTVHILAAMAEHEREQISARTKAALATAKARGTKLGWAIPSRQQEQPVEARMGTNKVIAEADSFAANVLPIIHAIRDAGVTTLTGIAAALNARGIKTSRGGQWYPSTVKNVLRREARLRRMESRAA